MAKKMAIPKKLDVRIYIKNGERLLPLVKIKIKYFLGTGSKQ